MKLFQVALLFVGLSAGQDATDSATGAAPATAPVTVVRPAALTTSTVPRFGSVVRPGLPIASGPLRAPAAPVTVLTSTVPRFGSVVRPGLPIASGPLRAPAAPVTVTAAPKVTGDAKKDAEKSKKIVKAEAAVAKAEESLTAKEHGVQNKVFGAFSKSTVWDDKEDVADIKLFGKINSFQEAHIGEQQKAAALEKVLSDPTASEKDIEKAQLTHRSAQLMSTFKAMEAVDGESHKARTPAGSVALGMRSIDARISNAAYEAAQADPNYDPKKLKALKLSRDVDHVELLAQGSYIRENKDNAHILFLQSYAMKEPSAQAKLEKAWEAFNEDPSEENDIKLTIAEINLDIISVGKTQNYIKYKGTRSLLNAMMGARIAKLKREVADLQLELKMLALNELYGTATPAPIVAPSVPYGPVMRSPYYTVAGQPAVYSPYYHITSQTQS